MIIDIHIHEKTYSSDSNLSLEEIVMYSKKMGIDGVCITDHDNNSIMKRAKAYKKESDFLILVGAEVFTYEGDILVFGLDVLPQKRVHAKELVQAVSDKGGIAISAHPYRDNDRGLKDYLKSLPVLSGIEGFNGSTDRVNNLRACQIAKEMNLPLLGGSDAHNIFQLGKYATIFPDGIRDEVDFIEAVKQGNTQVAVFNGSGYEAINLNEEAMCQYNHKKI